MTVRLTVRYGDKVTTKEFADQTSLWHWWGSNNPNDGWPALVVVQELTAPEPTTWGKVCEGDEIIAPDNSCWRLESSDGNGQVYLTAIDDGRPLTFSVTDDMPIRRRPGVLTVAAQLLHDVGLYGSPA